MRIEKCDLCGRQIRFFEKRRLPEPVAILAEAEVVCRECRDTALHVEWKETVRDAIREAAER